MEQEGEQRGEKGERPDSQETRKEPEVIKPMSKKNLPSKICPVCKRPFTWRKKWERDWENVKYCSERCRRNKE